MEGEILMENSSINSNNSTAPVVDMPMKWHKFLIYFALWASMVVNALNAFLMLTGAQYGSEYDARMVYNYFDGLKGLDTFMGVLFVAMAVFAIVTRFSLAKYQAKGPKLLMAVYGLNTTLSLLYPLLASGVTDLPLGQLMDSSVISGLVTSIVMIFANRTYYNNRAHLFVN